MNKHILKQLISESYTGEELDPTKVIKIADVLTRSELKDYIRGLKDFESKTSVTLTVPEGMEDLELEPYKEVFPDKKLFVEKDPNLILGVKITDDDNVYEFNLRNTLEKMVEYIEKKYD